ncbi:MAG: LEA type 2 family protein [Phycisphaerales bacterium]|jgi:LEA14-like dessication related protein|nr:LEA type 2 family protein [Phycisphaerales bacterium]
MASYRFASRCSILLLLATLAGCAVQPSAKIAGIKVGNVSLQAATLIIDVDVTNPYFVPLPMTNLDYSLATSGQTFLDGQADTLGTVPANESKVLSLPIKVSYLDLFKAVQGIQGKSEIPYTATLGLGVDAPLLGVMRLPMEKSAVLKLPTKQSLINDATDVLSDYLKK